MPLSDNDKTNTTAEALVKGLQGAFGQHPGYRPAHAKGSLVTGTFTPTPTAGKLSKAQHFTSPSTPITIRFSNSTGIPVIPDTDPNASPRGLGIRFHLGGRKHTDIVAHSTPFFPVKTGEVFLAFLGALGAGGNTLNAFLGTHPETLAFIQAPKPTTESFFGLSYFGVNAFKLIADDGTVTYVRYRVRPTIDIPALSAEALKEKSPNFLFEELPERLKGGPVEFTLEAQIAEEGDVTNDATVHWPEERKVEQLGTLSLVAVEEAGKNEADQKYIIYDPVPRIDGVEPSDDPLIDMRASVYLISGRERRAAPELKV
ncbi:Catalase [Arthrobotrys entomopaga]|nr:Catalase [Arthrobotrys entomopaga]